MSDQQVARFIELCRRDFNCELLTEAKDRECDILYALAGQCNMLDYVEYKLLSL